MVNTLASYAYVLFWRAHKNCNAILSPTIARLEAATNIYCHGDTRAAQRIQSDEQNWHNPGYRFAS